MLSITLQKFTPKRYFQNTDGGFSIAWSVSLATVLFSVGTTFDIAQLTRAKLKSQSLADNIALIGAIYVKNHDGKDPSQFANSEGSAPSDAFMEGVRYNATDVGYNFSGMVKGGSEGVTFTINYDSEKKQSTVLVEGIIVPGFMQVMGKKALPFRSVSVVNYYEENVTNPASVFLVLDNSGSMALMDKKNSPDTRRGSPPSGATSRIDGLKSSVKNFMQQLEELNTAGTSSGKRIIRTAMYPYGNGAKQPQVKAQWGPISISDIDRMRAGGGTAPQKLLTKAESKLKDMKSANTEKQIHFAETGLEDPLRFLIYMTDGQNNGDLNQWVARNDSDYWRKWETTTGKWVYHAGTTAPDNSGWEEGVYDSTQNESVRQTCKRMKDEGVEVFTVAYSLDAGWYKGGASLNYTSYKTSDSTSRVAKLLMKDCASSGDHFLDAVDTSSLNQAFKAIGEKITAESIRIRS